MLLKILLFLPLFFAFILSLIPKKKIILLKQLSLLFSIIIFFYCIKLLGNFNIYYSYIQFQSSISYYPGMDFSIGIDGISIFFILLMSLLLPISLLVNWESVKYRNKDFTITLFILEFLVFCIFCCLDIFFFYIFFEGVLIPMFFIIGIWGSRQRKIHAVYQFFLYTFFGSIFMLVSFLIIYLHVGSTNWNIIKYIEFSDQRQLILWLGFFIAFAIKVPMIPFHIWLPEAHVEAPTTGSILLAGILLKLGTYGFLRFLLPLFPYGMKFFSPLVIVICIISVIYGSLVTIRQIDLKKIIAYSSVVHMNFAIIGLFANNLEGLQGSLFLMISHGIISSSLFFCIGVLYDRYHSRILYYYGGLVQVMPIFAVIFMIFSLSNMGFPGTSGFIGEILILIGVFLWNIKISLLLFTSVVFAAVYSIWLYNRLIFGEIKNYNIMIYNNFYYKKWFIKFSDITKREFFLILPFIFLNFLLGFYPDLIFNVTYLSILSLI